MSEQEDRRCRGRGLFGWPCRWEPRYDTKMPPGISVKGWGTIEELESFKNRIYVCDICTKCAAMRFRPSPSE